jgi:pyruvate dehydrogenase E2 component (dihydrolipoyllysine-residue acetyltransferase)
MPTDVVMPQMGESIAEGTIVRWIKKVGDQVARDEPLFEISTDKVDAEIPSPAAGVLAEVRVKEGETVPVNSVVAVIGPAGAPASKAPDTAAAAEPAPRAAEAPAKPEPAKPEPAKQPPPAAAQADGAPTTAAAQPAAPQPAPSTRTVEEPEKPVRQPPSQGVGEPRGSSPDQPASGGGDSSPAPAAPPAARPSEGIEDRLRQRSSPLVRKIAKDNNVDISRLHGTGIAGRVTKRDILDFIAQSGAAGAPAAQDGSPSLQQGAPPQQGPAASGPGSGPPPGVSGAPGLVQPMSVMRRKIAEHMVMSRRTSAHVHSVFEVNFSRVAQIRESQKAAYEKTGAKLTYLSFIIKAVVDALRDVPVVNASIDGDNVVYHRDVNLGIAVALDRGLIVPVIKKADELNLLGLSRAVADLAARARAKHLKPDEVAGGTFTITNPGVFGALFGMPIINQPQVAILGVGHIEKRPVVIDDAIAIRSMAYLTLGYDHRLIDGAVADEFMSHIKRQLENWDPAQA